MRYGICKAKHSEIRIKSNMRNWAKGLETIDGIKRTKAEIEQIVKEQWERIDDESACQFTNCEKEG